MAARADDVLRDDEERSASGIQAHAWRKLAHWQSGEDLVSALLKIDELTPDELQFYHERAGIRHYDGKLPLAEAERLAFEDVIGVKRAEFEKRQEQVSRRRA
jgi:hypothetical protein